MMTKWPTEKHDLQSAEKIIDKHLDLSGGEPLGIFELELQTDDSIDFRLAEWVQELHTHFAELYGDENGDEITRMVVSRCLTRGETIH